MKKVCVIGLGYVGLPTAILAAQAGLSVVGVDSNKDRVDKIKQCLPVIEEPEILEKLHTVIDTPHFKVTTDYEAADYFVVAVPTPFKDNKRADLSYISSAAMSIAHVIQKGNTVILESTVPVGATRSFAFVLEHETGLKSGKDFYVAHCPERVLPGNIFHELKVNDRIIGGIDPISVQKAAEFYKYFVSGDLYLTDASTAEMAKLIENSYSDVKSAFAHQVAEMAKKEGLNPYEVIELANKHPHVSILNPTCGVDDVSVAADSNFLITSFKEETTLLQAARNINNARPQYIFSEVKAEIEAWKKVHNKKCKVIALGISYKPDVNDINESPAQYIALELSKETEIDFLVCDPHITSEQWNHQLKSKMVLLKEGIETADIIVCLVAHSQFKLIDKKYFAKKRVLDYCGLFHSNRKESREQEQFFWPASESNDFYRSSMSNMMRADIGTSTKEQL
ncbi:nucleotide sugar dehydrogenase [Candidatus Babeliales bacterium]|nr:nucleotide sugar dehydrogenase [Candidatus Babeliales bacterium]